MIEKIEVIKDGNQTINLDSICNIKIKVNDVDKVFSMNTLNELDQNGLTKILVSEVLNDKLVKITNDEDWSKVKNAMRSIISGSKGDFEYANIPKKLVATGDYFRVIAVQDAAKNSLKDGYAKNKPEETSDSSVTPVIENTEEVTPAIYPQNDSNQQIGSEVVPGIIETPVQNEPTLSAVTDIPVNNSNEVVSNVSSEKQLDIPVVDTGTFENNVVDSDVSAFTGGEKNTVNDDAKAILIDKITKAVSEYVDSLNVNNKTNNDEVDRLKAELDEKTKKLNEIMSLLGK
jgi:hypothetical protein